MKKILYLMAVLLLSFGIYSCDENKEEYLFEGSVNERFEELKTNYVNVLANADNGWIGYYAPNSKVGGFAILMDFDQKGNVKMASDYNEGANDNTSTYRIDKGLKIQLVFESHGVLAQIYETTNNGVDGEYVFYIESVSEEEVVLKSATDFGYDGSGITELKLVPAKSEHWNFESIYENTPKLADGYNTDKFFRAIYVEGTDVKKSFSYVKGYSKKEINRYAIIKSLKEEGGVQEERLSIAVSYKGLKFINPYVINGKEVSDFVYDETSNRFVSKDGGQTTIIEHTDEPAVIYYPSVNIGEDGEFLSQQHFPFWLIPSIKQNSSERFNDAMSNAGIRRFFIDYNSDAQGIFSQKYEAIISIEYYVGTGWSARKKWAVIPCEVERVKDERIIFNPLVKLEEVVTDSQYSSKLQTVFDILVNKKGFYVEQQQQQSLYGPYPGYFFISKNNPNFRFSTIVF